MFLIQGEFMNRFDNRKFDQMRFVKITRNYLKYAEGSVLIEVGIPKLSVQPLLKKEFRHF